MHDSRFVANRFLELADRANDTLSPMQLLKLVYIAHGWMLGLHGRPLIRDEVHAWQYGPVIPRLYNVTRKFKSQPVQGPLPAAAEELTADESAVVDRVYALYGNLTGPALSRITHAVGTPWEVTYRPGEFGMVISNDIIEDHYRKLSRELATN